MFSPPALALPPFVGQTVKFRSLVCKLLNCSALAACVEILAAYAATSAGSRWFRSWAFMRSPATIEIGQDLERLTPLKFDLVVDFELTARPSAPKEEED